MKVVTITAVWCSSCLLMRPRFMEVKKNYPNIEFVNYDIDLDEESSFYNVGNILPVFILYDNDKEVDRLIGENKVNDILKVIEKYLDKKE